MKKAVFILILIVTISFTMNTLLSVDFSSNNSFNTFKEVKVNAQVTSEDQNKQIL
ncbi:hypothetical protein [Methanobacterium sp. A39]|jgi:hypothetical protein|uniref:hypothetical protein n=1 Tax=Methanobacterium sp. A39 TaxID=1860100 RepID=UPI0015B63833|nr:hypothetical protein [Methanobacterium sp. A39]